MEFSLHDVGQIMAGFLHAARPPVPSSPDPGVLNLLNQILKEITTMSDAQTQEAADVAQLTGDLTALKSGFQALTDKIAALQDAATRSGTVSPDLQAQIDALHSFAQSVAPPATPTPAFAPASASTSDAAT